MFKLINWLFFFIFVCTYNYNSSRMFLMIRIFSVRVCTRVSIQFFVFKKIISTIKLIISFDWKF